MHDLSSRSLFWVAIGLEVIAVGVGAIITPSVGVILALIGLLLFSPAIKEYWGKRKVRASIVSAKTRIYIQHTFQELMDLVSNRTGLEGQLLVERFIGTWMKVSGPVEDIDGLSVLINTDPDNRNQFRVAHLGGCFAETWKDRLSVLKRGQNIVVVGRIDTIDHFGVGLMDCELLS
jgi:hypothetical protein